MKRKYSSGFDSNCECLCHKRTGTVDYCGYCSTSHSKSETGLSREIEIPKANPYIQFLTSDSKGNIWFAEEHGNSLGVITHSPIT
jgi:hypothetical protein